MFGRKRMTQEEIAQRMQEIENMTEQDAYRAALALEKDAPEAAAVTLAQAYFLGNVVERDFNLCTQYAQRALSKYPDKGVLWFYGGVAYSALEDYAAAINFLKRATECAEIGIYAATNYAYNCYMYASQMKSASNNTWKIHEYNATNYNAALWYAESVGKYSEVAENCISEMDVTDWFVYGTGLHFLLEMAYQGQLTDLGVTDNGVGSWISASFKALDSKMNQEQNEFWKNYCWHACAQMDAAGRHMIAETCRACFSSYIAKFEHDANAYYRARWHYAKAFDLLKDANEEEHDTWNSFHDIILDVYQNMKRTYGAMTVNQMLDGVLPNLAPSYPEGAVPDPESCAGFMEEFHRERDMAQMKHDLRTGKTDNPEKKKGGLFGLFRK